jgi:hypothetical protein
MKNQNIKFSRKVKKQSTIVKGFVAVRSTNNDGLGTIFAIKST